jgi:hypothetical protein
VRDRIDSLEKVEVLLLLLLHRSPELIAERYSRSSSVRA